MRKGIKHGEQLFEGLDSTPIAGSSLKLPASLAKSWYAVQNGELQLDSTRATINSDGSGVRRNC
jgi:hypothetical protein